MTKKKSTVLLSVLAAVIVIACFVGVFFMIKNNQAPSDTPNTDSGTMSAPPVSDSRTDRSASTDTDQNVPTDTDDTTSKEPSAETIASLEPYRRGKEELPLKDLPVYDFFRFFSWHVRWMPYSEKGYFDEGKKWKSFFALSFDITTSVQHVEWVDDNHCFAVYRIEDQLSERKREETYAFVMLRKDENEWHLAGETYFVNALKSSQDYAFVTVGTPVSEVMKTDSGVYYDLMPVNAELNCYKESPYKDNTIRTLTTVRVLTDGILIMQFDSSAQDPIFDDLENSGLTVTRVDWRPYGTEMPELITLKNADPFRCLNNLE